MRRARSIRLWLLIAKHWLQLWLWACGQTRKPARALIPDASARLSKGCGRSAVHGPACPWPTLHPSRLPRPQACRIADFRPPSSLSFRAEAIVEVTLDILWARVILLWPYSNEATKTANFGQDRRLGWKEERGGAAAHPGAQAAGSPSGAGPAQGGLSRASDVAGARGFALTAWRWGVRDGAGGDPGGELGGVSGRAVFGARGPRASHRRGG
jgi:hypothetical protein